MTPYARALAETRARVAKLRGGPESRGTLGMYAAARSVSCPTCGALAHQPCRSLGRFPDVSDAGEPIQLEHMARRRKLWGPGS